MHRLNGSLGRFYIFRFWRQNLLTTQIVNRSIFSPEILEGSRIVIKEQEKKEDVEMEQEEN